MRGPAALLRISLIAAGALAVATASCLCWSGDHGFTSALTPGLTDQLADKFGAPARTRLFTWQKFVGSLRATIVRDEGPPAEREREILAAVNSFFNEVPLVDDLKHWGVLDYWASPAEMVASHGADCEDFAIAKYFALKEAGIPIAKLRITYANSTRFHRPHMVLVYDPGEDADPLVLDNLEHAIRPVSQRPDLIPIYSFNDDEGKLLRERTRVTSNQIRAWRRLLEKLERERRT